MRAFRRALFAGMAAAAVVPTNADSRELVAYAAHPPGTIVVRTSERRLYLVLGRGAAIRYRVAVGRPDRQWFGAKRIEAKSIRPIWGVPAEVRKAQPWLPSQVPPGPKNPLGAAALALGPGGEYAIHGTNTPSSIGTFASWGCFRMFNEDVLDLYARVQVGTPVLVLP